FVGKPVVAGRLDGTVDHDCVGVIDNADNWLGSGDTAFAMYWTCDLTPDTNPPKTALWIGLPLPNSGFPELLVNSPKPHQFMVGDYTGSGVETLAIRRGPYFVWSNLAQYFDTFASNWGEAVSGDWDGDGISTFGIAEDGGGIWYRCEDLTWHPGIYKTQSLRGPLGFTNYDMSVWRSGGS
ncbi:MAG TPA: hypothetical protein VFS60_01450, partial [Thermoanaerobaculia bacterium]|nr:hypothetical protein [Thermoanaerobaculia bacterium]